jgi:hypothetical protein
MVCSYNVLIDLVLIVCKVAITAPSSSDALYAPGVYGVLGYGLDAKPGVPANSTLLGIYLP